MPGNNDADVMPSGRNAALHDRQHRRGAPVLSRLLPARAIAEDCVVRPADALQREEFGVVEVAFCVSA